MRAMRHGDALRAACRPARRSCSGSAASAPIRSIRSPAKADRRTQFPRLVDADNYKPIRSKVASGSFPFEVARLQPRHRRQLLRRHPAARFIEYKLTINGDGDQRTAPHQFLAVRAAEVEAAVPVFRHVAPPGRVVDGGNFRSAGGHGAQRLPFDSLHVHAIKKTQRIGDGVGADRICQSRQVPNPALRPRRRVGRAAFERMSAAQRAASDPRRICVFPDGPFTGEVADTLINFSEGTLEDAQP